MDEFFFSSFLFVSFLLLLISFFFFSFWIKMNNNSREIRASQNENYNSWYVLYFITEYIYRICGYICNINLTMKGKIIIKKIEGKMKMHGWYNMKVVKIVFNVLFTFSFFLYFKPLCCERGQSIIINRMERKFYVYKKYTYNTISNSNKIENFLDCFLRAFYYFYLTNNNVVYISYDICFFFCNFSSFYFYVVYEKK